MTISTVAALQIGSSPKARPARWNACLPSNPRSLPPARAGGHARGAAGRLSQGEIFGTRLGYRLPEGREAYARYHDNAIDVPGPETEALASLSQRTGASLVVGRRLVAKHRKLMPTGTERLIWGQGDGSTLPVVDTPAGRVGGAICWKTTCRCCACMRKACRSGARPPWTSATSGNARCATSPTKAAAS